jgi:transposase
LLTAIYEPAVPAHLRELPAVQILRRTWICQYYAHEGRLRWRKAEDLPPAALRSDSPYDPEAHYGNKRSHTWTGYKVHVTETCDDDEVHLITHVETTLAGVTDSDLSAPIQEALAQKTLLPGEHFLDAGYVDADLLVTSRKELGIEVVGPVRASFQLASPSWAGLRCGALSGGLASPAGRLPTRLHQYVLDPSYRCLGQPGD